MPPNVPPDAQLDRFLNDCRAVAPVAREHRIGVAVSGGPDSLALLLLAHGTFGAQVHAATVDHGLRRASASEAAFVGDLCRDLGVPHVTLRLATRLPRGNISARARELRYALLDDWRQQARLDWLMTGHHADDQLETVIMRLNRGAGVGGVAGVRARNGQVLRPLLGWRHSELVDLVAAAGPVAIDDPSNRDDRYDRARLRKALGDADFLDPIAFTRAAAALDEADAALNWSAAQWAAQNVRTEGNRLSFDPQGLPVELERRILENCIRTLNPKARFDGPRLSRLLVALRRGKKATLDKVAVDARGSRWILELAPPRRTG